VLIVPQKRRDQANWLQRRKEVVDHAAHLFAANGYHATGVAELGDGVGLARGALYYYIESKDTLLTLIHDTVMSEVLAAGNAAREMDTSATERLRFLGRELVRIITEYPDHVWVFLHEFRNLQGDAATSFRKQRREFEERIEEILVDGCKSGEFEVVDTRLAALAWLGLHNYIYIWHHPDSAFTAEIIADQFGSIFLGGIKPK
jgi:AcrR family transcriptional regulator